jgi:predicted peptidase
MTALRMLLPAAGVLLLLPLSPARADEKAETGFIDRVYKDADGKEAKYVIFVPKNYDAKKASPLILFLHGSGESGSDGKKQVDTGLGKAIKAKEDSFPFIAVFPQSEKRNWKADSLDGKRALAILAEVEKEYKVDAKRVYLTGLSMGGYGAWSFAYAHPNKWAAIVPICGGADPKVGEKALAEKIKDIPCWCFHGDADKAVNVERSREIIKALKDAGAKNVEYTEYEKVGHNSWDKAYGTKELYEWLLKHELK